MTVKIEEPAAQVQLVFRRDGSRNRRAPTGTSNQWSLLLKGPQPETVEGRLREISRRPKHAARATLLESRQVTAIRLPLFYAGDVRLGTQTASSPGRIPRKGIRCICSSTCWKCPGARVQNR